MKKIFVVFKTARQVEGEMVFISVEKAFEDSKKAEDYWRQKPTIWREDLVNPEDSTRISCECRMAIHETELED